MFLVTTFTLMTLFLIGTFSLTALSYAFRNIQKWDSKKQLPMGGQFFYRNIHGCFFPGSDYEGLFFAVNCAQNLTRYAFAASSIIFLFATPLFEHSQLLKISTIPQAYSFTNFWIGLTLLCFIVISFVIGEYLPRFLGLKIPETMMRATSFISSLFMTLWFPIIFAILKISHLFARALSIDVPDESDSQVKQEMIDIIHEADVSQRINRHDRKIIESVFSFGQRIAREVMVPRVNIFSINASVSIREAAKLIGSEGYSRIPIYKNTIDEITGLVMYKDILAKFLEYAEKGNDNKVLSAPVESIRKNVLYTPETKKISNLLQEFRKKQVHIAIVVDEYGGTEGIVTIEDILEEIVGEIADEYDETESLYTLQSDGSLIVDARMGIFDLEELLKIDIPQEGDYDTIGGYVFHFAGTIPAKGFTIHENQFEVEVLSSNERFVEKVRITRPSEPQSKVIN